MLPKLSKKYMLSNKNLQSSFSQFQRCHEFYVFRLLNQFFFFEQFGNSLSKMFFRDLFVI